MAGAHVPPPPLAEAVNRGVVTGHRRIDLRGAMAGEQDATPESVSSPAIIRESNPPNARKTFTLTNITPTSDNESVISPGEVLQSSAHRRL